MIAGLAACGQTTTTTPAVDTTAKAPAQVLGFAAVTFTDVNTDHMTVSVKTSSVEDGLAGLTSQTLSRPAMITMTQTSLRGAVQDTPATHRFMYGTLNVTNNSETTYKNVTLLGVNIPGYHAFDTGLQSAFNIGGTPVTLAEYHAIVPTNPRAYDDMTGAFIVPAIRADYQMYDESYIQNITNFMSSRYGGTAFPYGFVARKKLSMISREIAPGTNTGQVTMAFATPDATDFDQPRDIKTFTFVGLITADAVTTASADVYETSLARACAAVKGFGGNAVHGFAGQTPDPAPVVPGDCVDELEPSLRTSGTQATPTTTITYASHP